MSYIGQQLPADTFQGFVTDSFTGDGSATTFTLSKAPFSEDTLIVVINNVIQKPTTNFTVSGTTLTIVGTAVASGDVIYAIHMGGSLPIGEVNKLDLNGGSDQLILDADADTTISADTDDQIDFKAGGTDTMHIINGKVGIGTSSPAKHLSLKTDGGGAAVGIDIHNQGTDNADDALITFETQGHRNFSLGIDRSESNFVIMSEADGLGTPRITVDDDGKVGIGTSSPSTNLHIFSTADNAPHLLLENFQNADTDDAAVLEFYLNDETTGGISDNTDVGVIRFTGDEKDGGTKETYAEIRGVAHDPGQTTSNKGNLSFFVQKAGSLAETMTLDDSENVFNDGGVDHDFRVEGDSLSHMLFVDASLDQVNIGSNTDYSAVLGVIQSKTDHNGLNVEGANSSYASTALNIGVIRNSSGEYNFINCEARGFAHKFRVTDAGTVLAVTTTISSISDERIKQDITDANSQWDDIKALKFKNFKRKTSVRNEGDDALRELGVIAQDVEAAGMTGLIDYSDPDTGHVQDDPTFGTLYTQEDEDAGNIPSGKFVNEVKEVKEKVKMVKYSIIWMKAVKALQEAMAKIETLETKVKALEDA